MPKKPLNYNGLYLALVGLASTGGPTLTIEELTLTLYGEDHDGKPPEGALEEVHQGINYLVDTGHIAASEYTRLGIERLAGLVGQDVGLHIVPAIKLSLAGQVSSGGEIPTAKTGKKKPKAKAATEGPELTVISQTEVGETTEELISAESEPEQDKWDLKQQNLPITPVDPEFWEHFSELPDKTVIRRPFMDDSWQVRRGPLDGTIMVSKRNDAGEMEVVWADIIEDSEKAWKEARAYITTQIGASAQAAEPEAEAWSLASIVDRKPVPGQIEVEYQGLVRQAVFLPNAQPGTDYVNIRASAETGLPAVSHKIDHLEYLPHYGPTMAEQLKGVLATRD